MHIFKRYNPGLISAILLLAMAVVACRGGTSPLTTPPTSSPPPTTTSTPTLSLSPTTSTPTLQPILSLTYIIETPMILTPQPETTHLSGESIEEQAQKALAHWLGISSEEIEVIEVEEIEWPDTSLGCPETGKVYAQVITPGYRIVLEAAGESYACHTDAKQQVVCCEPPGPRPIPGSGATDPVELAKKDLARRLGVPIDSIALLAVLHQEFTHNAFYCQTVKERISREESPAIVSGETILLSAGGRKYEYHASDKTVIFCRRLS